MSLRSVCLVGTTASGKSQLAHDVARERNDLELICVDSMTVYRRMDIGTAKPTEAEQAEVTYHLLDQVEPWEEYSVADFQQTSRKVVQDVASRGASLLYVGGTGLYARAVVDNFDIPGQFPEVKSQLEREAAENLEELFAELVRIDPVAAQRMESTNARRIVRALEVIRGSGQLFSSFGSGLREYPTTDVVHVGIRREISEIDRRVEERFAAMVTRGLVEEVEELLNDPKGLSRTAAQAVGYKEIIQYLRGEVSLDEALANAVIHSRRLARRQRSWFNRDPRIIWCDNEEEATAILHNVFDNDFPVRN